ncbi:NADPH:quinone reductase [Halorussus salinisoli]|uniref:NADPH:quinone reductase n=1 Tax=Halorussus salinisoli TaxID=2558242 RepID=UPI0010C21BD0|nr:NADPH:quinone reductase [Halorussus salinisoli]
MPDRMRAARYHEHGEPDVLAVEEVPKPTPDREEVLVETRAAGINPIDTYVMAGDSTPADGLPAIAGSDLAGIVVDVGEDVTKYELGDWVYATALGIHDQGSLAEYVPVPVDILAPLPESVSFTDGAAAAMAFATAWRGLITRGELRLGESCLIAGAAGGVGHAGVQVATEAGATVIGLARKEGTDEFVREQGVDSVVDYRSDELADEISAAVGDGLDVALETHADANLIPEVEAAARGGRIVVLGEEGPIEIDPGLSMSAKKSDLDVRFMSIAASRDDHASLLTSVAPLLAEGTFIPSIDSQFPLDEAVGAYRRLSESGVRGCVVVTFE